MGFGDKLRNLREAIGLGVVDDVPSWRRRFTLVALLCAAVALPLSMIFVAPAHLSTGHWPLLVMDGAVCAWCVASLVARRGFFAPRPASALLVLGVMTFTFLWALGPGGARSAWVIAFVVISALLFGVRGALVASAVAIAMLMGLWATVGPVAEEWREAYHGPLINWLRYLITVTLLGLFASLPCALLVRGLRLTLDREQRIRMQLTSERAELERAYETLQRESAERERLERHVRQAQKMEALGRLSGGIAHDLNNMLMPLIAYPPLIERGLPEGGRERRLLGQLASAGESMRELVEQVLLFGRDVPPPDAHVQLSALLAELTGQLRDSLPRDIELRLELADVRTVLANRAALLRVFLNLCRNAIGAMKRSGGALTLSLDAVAGGETPDDPRAQLPTAGSYLRVRVTDTGTGMDEHTMSHAFEPFFTTKEFGRGTGLGLAIVHGVVTALKGCITIDSEPGEGTTFRVYLPVSEGPPGAAAPPPASDGKPIEGRVLLVDDNPHTLASIQHQLETFGVESLAVDSGEAALAELERGDFEVLVSDVQMPEMTGFELAAVIRERWPGLPIVFATGYADPAITAEAEGLGVEVVLPKPFPASELAAALARVAATPP